MLEFWQEKYNEFTTYGSTRVFDRFYKDYPCETLSFVRRILELGHVRADKKDTYCDYEVVRYKTSFTDELHKGLPSSIDIYARLDFLFGDIDKIMLEIYDLLH